MHDKENGIDTRQAGGQYEAIHMPKNTAAGISAGAFALIFGFAAVWYIWWLAAIGLVGVIATIIARSANKDIDYYIPAEEVARIENEHTRKLMAQAAE
jgi:cytochrome o ubiquinol oxidase subunit 1